MNACRFQRITAEELDAALGTPATSRPTSRTSLADYLERAASCDADLSDLDDLDDLLTKAADGAATAAQMAELEAWTRFLQQEANTLAAIVACPDERASINPMP
ncbi:hypothetical protein [Rubrivivax albus]|uniref:Uncharacterized protein n=1 Tax=Rubrivivax albus TaxID=2499835 RepID=A0A437JT56_9BURK|nr:hypothetical protein [Rubrivivax albus]RVT50351.1 hypothetical protein ENE75_15135 [Rubrivivax albus]